MSLIQRPASTEQTRTLPRPLTNSLLIALALTIMGLAGFATLAQTSSVTERGYRLRDLEQQRTQLQAQVHQLEVEVASLASLDHLQREAQARFNMRPAPADQTVYIQVDSAPQPPSIPSRFLPETEVTPSSYRPWWQTLIDLLPGP